MTAARVARACPPWCTAIHKSGADGHLGSVVTDHLPEIRCSDVTVRGDDCAAWEAWLVQGAGMRTLVHLDAYDGECGDTPVELLLTTGEARTLAATLVALASTAEMVFE